MTRAIGSAARPRFSIVTAVYDVERYLPAFIESLDRQRFPAVRFEIIAVDDGSRDGSLAKLQAWAARSEGRVKVVTQANGGQASARNLGLEHASGEWVTFPDPDDLLEPSFLGAADAFATGHPAIELMSGRPVILDETAGSRRLDHPRQWQYEAGDRVADLAAEPNVFLGVSSGSFFRLDRIREARLTFDTRIRPSFEDGHFAARYLLALPRPAIGLVPESVYLYRKRASGDSTMQGSMAHPGRYGDVLELGYLDLFDRGRGPDGAVPAWLQQLVVYELSWYLSGDERDATTVRVPPDAAPRFHALLDRILAQLEPAVVERHRARRLQPVWIDLLARAGRGTDWHAPVVVRSRRDRAMRLRRFQYRFVGRPPVEAFRVGGVATQPAFEKTMAHRYFGRDLLWERIVWLRDHRDIVVALDGVDMPQVRSVAPARPGGRRRAARGGRAGGGRARGVRAGSVRARGARVLASRLMPFGSRALRRLRTLAAEVVARVPPYRRRFRDAWAVMDRIHDADDNGERLFEYLRRERPEINAWFVLERGTPDWRRLAASGEGRLVAHGSWAWTILMLNCSWLLSSHVDRAIVEPLGLAAARPRPAWRLGFLQHGVIKDDLSRWLNRIELELFVVSTDAELASVAGDGTAYRFSAKETRRTGLPRFDRLLRKGREIPPEERNLVIVAPTWRKWLTLPLAAGSQRREIDAAFQASAYVTSWLGLLRSEAVAAAARDRGLRLAFMPHPNLQTVLDQLDLPAHVERLPFSGTDVQDVYARCALLVTDYSSVAFNVAYLDRPVVYFQFDRDEMLGGLHVGRQGYFDYARDGFGPVAEDAAAAEAAIVDAIRRGPVPGDTYQERIDRTFPDRDGQACARVVQAVEELSRPWTGTEEPPAPQLTDRSI